METHARVVVIGGGLIGCSILYHLAKMGWKLLMQIHDEVILEGPEESADEALALVKWRMEHPFRGTNPLEVDLAVDAKTAKTWYEAK